MLDSSFGIRLKHSWGDWHSPAVQLVKVASGVVDLLPLNMPENRGPYRKRISD
jgi:hypothetical protein